MTTVHVNDLIHRIDNVVLNGTVLRKRSRRFQSISIRQLTQSLSRVGVGRNYWMVRIQTVFICLKRMLRSGGLTR